MYGRSLVAAIKEKIHPHDCLPDRRKHFEFQLFHFSSTLQTALLTAVLSERANTIPFKLLQLNLAHASLGLEYQL